VYIPRSFAEHDVPTIHDFIEANPLAAIVSASPADGLTATHLPLVLDRAAGPMGTLIGHLARANPHSRHLTGGSAAALVIFAGPEAYITPAWYQTKKETGRDVPTWNYVAIHAYGTLHLRDDPAFLRAHLEALTNTHEGSREHPWHVSDAPEEYIVQQMQAIVAVELPIDRLEGKWKMSQNRRDADIAGVIDGLAKSGKAMDREVGAIVSERRPKS
jgi:transcriptional regulator